MMLLTGTMCYGDSWIPKANFGGPIRSDAAGCAINGKGYIGTGYANGYSKDWWEYDPLTDAWTQKADFIGNSTVESTCIAILGKAYFLPYINGNNFYAYDPVTNTWTMKATFPGQQRQGAIGFAIDNKGYFGLGSVSGAPSPYSKDLWEYDPITDSWNQKADLPGVPRMHSAAFSLGSKGFVGLGLTSSGNLNEFWEYDATTNAWTQKSNFPGGLRYEGTAFSVGGYGFMGGGYMLLPMNDFWRYDAQTDTWSPIAPLPHVGIVETVCFTIGNYAYMGTGWDGNVFMNNFWQYSTDSIAVSVNEMTPEKFYVQIYPNPSKDYINVISSEINQPLKVTVVDSRGKLVYSDKNFFSEKKISTQNMSEGNYFITLQNDRHSKVIKLVVNK